MRGGGHEREEQVGRTAQATLVRTPVLTFTPQLEIEFGECEGRRGEARGGGHERGAKDGRITLVRTPVLSLTPLYRTHLREMTGGSPAMRWIICSVVALRLPLVIARATVYV